MNFFGNGIHHTNMNHPRVPTPTPRLGASPTPIPRMPPIPMPRPTVPPPRPPPIKIPNPIKTELKAIAEDCMIGAAAAGVGKIVTSGVAAPVAPIIGVAGCAANAAKGVFERSTKKK